MFYFYEPVVYAEPDETKFPENSKCLGLFLGVAKNVGHNMNFILRKAENLQVITRSAVRRLKDHHNPCTVNPQSAVPLVTGGSPPDSVTVNPSPHLSALRPLWMLRMSRLLMWRPPMSLNRTMTSYMLWNWKV